MAARLNRTQLYDLVWSKPIIHLAAEFGLSDVGLRKACHRHDIPTPPAGWWAKKAHGKAARATPLPGSRPADELVHLHGYGAEAGALDAARATARARLDQAQDEDIPPDKIVERTIARLERAKVGREGLKRVSGRGLLNMEVRLSSVERAGELLRARLSIQQNGRQRVALGADCRGERAGAFRPSAGISRLTLLEPRSPRRFAIADVMFIGRHGTPFSSRRHSLDA